MRGGMQAREENLGSAAIFREDLDQAVLSPSHVRRLLKLNSPALRSIASRALLEALSHLALLQEQLAERQVAVQRLRSECQRPRDVQVDLAWANLHFEWLEKGLKG